MIHSVNLTLCPAAGAEYGGWEGLRRELEELGCDGVEGIWGGGEIPDDFPKELLGGYHLTFFPDWLDFYREDRKALLDKYGDMATVRRFYGGVGRETLMSLYRADLDRAEALGARYVVFHVSDVSIVEGYTYRWLHRNREVIDASIEVINQLLEGRPHTFAFLMENQWWPGFTFTEPEETARLLEGVRYPGKGLLLDTGHLMNANLDLQTQAEGAAFIAEMLRRHGNLCRCIRGVHLHQSLSGAYVRANTGQLPPDLPEDCVERFGVSYRHILQVDRHRPWTDPAILPVLEKISPDFLTHELQAGSREERRRAVSVQRALLASGGF